jgi:hypothetical protein
MQMTIRWKEGCVTRHYPVMRADVCQAKRTISLPEPTQLLSLVQGLPAVTTSSTVPNDIAESIQTPST